MKRLLATVRLDVLNQFRQGFYLASVVVLLFLCLAAAFVPVELGAVLPAILLTNMTIATFVFLGGIVLLEKGEGTLEGSMISPLRPDEYLVSKITTLTLLAVVENLVITGVAQSQGLIETVSWTYILLGSLLSGTLYTLLGFLTVIRYDSLNDYLFPMFFATVLLELPGAICLGMPEFKLLAVLPTYALLWLFRAAIEPVSNWALAYAIGYPLLWLGISFFLASQFLQAYTTGRLTQVNS